MMTPEEQAREIVMDWQNEESLTYNEPPRFTLMAQGRLWHRIAAALRTAREEAQAAINMKLFNESIAQVRREERCFFLDALMDIADALGCGKHPEGHVDRAKEIAREALDRARAQERP